MTGNPTPGPDAAATITPPIVAPPRDAPRIDSEQLRALRELARYIALHGYPPTPLCLGTNLAIGTNRALDRLAELATLRLIEPIPNTQSWQRNIQITATGKALLAGEQSA